MQRTLDQEVWVYAIHVLNLESNGISSLLARMIVLIWNSFFLIFLNHLFYSFENLFSFVKITFAELFNLFLFNELDSWKMVTISNIDNTILIRLAWLISICYPNRYTNKQTLSSIKQNQFRYTTHQLNSRKKKTINKQKINRKSLLLYRLHYEFTFNCVKMQITVRQIERERLKDKKKKK